MSYGHQLIKSCHGRAHTGMGVRKNATVVIHCPPMIGEGRRDAAMNERFQCPAVDKLRNAATSGFAPVSDFH
jgi:hypothetical protein